MRWEHTPHGARDVFTENGPAVIAEERGGLLAVSAAQLAIIAQPTLLVAGADSPAEFADATRRVAAAMPTARVAGIGGGHLIHPAHPVIVEFIDEVLGVS